VHAPLVTATISAVVAFVAAARVVASGEESVAVPAAPRPFETTI
jgi:hypothetical protein